MTFVVEDGTGLTNANAYCSVAFADTYFSERNITAWTGISSVKESAIINATDYIDARWGSILKGTVASTDQALYFPRLNIGFDDEVPLKLQRACAEYALRALSGKLAPDPIIDSSGKSIQSTKKKVGPLETEITYATDGPNAAITLYRNYPAADLLMKPFLISSNKLIR